MIMQILQFLTLYIFGGGEWAHVTHKATPNLYFIYWLDGRDQLMYHISPLPLPYLKNSLTLFIKSLKRTDKSTSMKFCTNLYMKLSEEWGLGGVHISKKKLHMV